MYLGSELATSHLSPAPWQFNVSRDSNTDRNSDQVGLRSVTEIVKIIIIMYLRSCVCVRAFVPFKRNQLISVFCKQTFLNMKNR